MTKTQNLTQGEQRYLMYAPRAHDEGTALAENCRQTGLNARTLDNTNTALRRKRCTQAAVVNAAKSSSFLEVRIAPSPVSSAVSDAAGGSRHTTTIARLSRESGRSPSRSLARPHRRSRCGKHAVSPASCVFRSWKAAIPTDAGPGFRKMPGRV